MYINIHTHNPLTEGVRGIRNLYRQFELVQEEGFFSAGLHPWFLSESGWEKEFEKLQISSKHPHVVAIGECGLDKVCSTPFGLQQQVFAKQIELANELKKPLIIHCVKAFQEVTELLKRHHTQVPVIFHGFNKGGPLALQLVKQGYYLSFGKQLLRSPHLQQLLPELPSTHIFLETDDADVSIQELYKQAALSLQIQEKALSLQLAENANRVFGI